MSLASPLARKGLFYGWSLGSDRSADALTILARQHRVLERLFTDYDRAPAVRKQAVCDRLCAALRLHARIEAELLYPAARETLAARDEPLVEELVAKHGAATVLIGEIEAMRVGDPLYDARMQVLCEMIEQHIEEAEAALFPRLRRADLDLIALGARMARRREELLADRARART